MYSQRIGDKCIKIEGRDRRGYVVMSSLVTVQRFFTCTCSFIPPLSTPSGGDLRDGNPADEIPRVAAVRLLPGAGVGLQAPDSGHTRGTAFCHCGGSGPCDWYMCQQHCTMPTTVQQDRGVSDAATLCMTVKGTHTQLKLEDVTAVLILPHK